MKILSKNESGNIKLNSKYKMETIKIRFTNEVTNVSDCIIQIQNIYKNILSGTTKVSYNVCMGRSFDFSETEYVIKEIQKLMAEKSGRIVNRFFENTVKSAESYDVYNPVYVDITYYITHSS